MVKRSSSDLISDPGYDKMIEQHFSPMAPQPATANYVSANFELQTKDKKDMFETYLDIFTGDLEFADSEAIWNNDGSNDLFAYVVGTDSMEDLLIHNVNEEAGGSQKQLAKEIMHDTFGNDPTHEEKRFSKRMAKDEWDLEYFDYKLRVLDIKNFEVKNGEPAWSAVQNMGDHILYDALDGRSDKKAIKFLGKLDHPIDGALFFEAEKNSMQYFDMSEIL